MPGHKDGDSLRVFKLSLAIRMLGLAGGSKSLGPCLWSIYLVFLCILDPSTFLASWMPGYQQKSFIACFYCLRPRTIEPSHSGPKLFPPLSCSLVSFHITMKRRLRTEVNPVDIRQRAIFHNGPEPEEFLVVCSSNINASVAGFE